MIPSPWNKLRGRPSGVRFPIRRTVVEAGEEITKTISENMAVHCLRCGKQFLVNQDTVYRIRHPFDDGPYIRCPHCGFKAADSHYFDQVPRPRPIRNPEEYAVRIITPER